MPQSLSATQPKALHPITDSVQLANEIRTRLQGVRSTDKKVQQLRKHIQSRMNRAPETVAVLLSNDSPLNGVVFGDTISAFFRRHIPKNRKPLRALSLLETREEGDVNCVQATIDQGDTSTPNLLRFKKELVEYIVVLKEIEEVVDHELASRI